MSQVTWVKNSTGVTLSKGSLVKADVGNDDSVVLTAASDLDPVGVVLENIPAGTWGRIVVSGRAEVYIDNVAGCSREDWLGVSTATAGQASAGIIPFPPSQDAHFREIGHTLRARGSAGLVWAVVHFN